MVRDSTLYLFIALSIGATVAFGVVGGLAAGIGTFCTIWALNLTALLAVERAGH